MSASTLPELASPRSSVAIVAGGLLCFLTILFASGDLWPVVRIGFTFRFSQLCIVLAALLIFAGGTGFRVRLFPGWYWLACFLIWILGSMPFSQYLERSVGYVAWVFQDAMIIFVFVQFFNTKILIEKLLRYWLSGFVAISIFGVVQFLLGVAGHDLFVSQWWFRGVLPRVNGLSYEPSYYATYLLPGWVTCAYLIENRASILSRRLTKFCILVITLALFLSSSRMGWMMMLIWFVWRLCVWAWRLARCGRVERSSVYWLTAAMCVASFVLVFAIERWGQVVDAASGLQFLVNGLGVAGTAAHSSDERLSVMALTFRAFTNHPLVGTGIGALPVEIARLQGAGVPSLDAAKEYEGMSIFVELLASTGVVGGFLMLGFFASLWRAVSRALLVADREYVLLIKGVSYGVFWLMLILQFNQNFLRIYLFVDLAVLICLVICAKRNTVVRQRVNELQAVCS